MELARPARERGQASVELLGTVPAVLLVAALVWELALVGQSAWLCANAARSAASARRRAAASSAAARARSDSSRQSAVHRWRSDLTAPHWSTLD